MYSQKMMRPGHVTARPRHPATPHSTASVSRGVRRVRMQSVGSSQGAVSPEAGTSSAEPSELMPLSELPVLEGDPEIGMAAEIMAVDFDWTPFFEKHGENFVANLGYAGGYTLVTRTPSQIFDIMENSKEIKIGWPDSVLKMVFPFQRVVSDDDSAVWRAAVQRAISPAMVEKLHVPLMVQEFQTRLRRHAQSGEEIMYSKEARIMALSVAARALLGDLVSNSDVEFLHPLEIDNGDALFAPDDGLPEGKEGSAYRAGIDARKTMISFYCEKLEKVLKDAEGLKKETSVCGRLLDGLKEEGVIDDSTPIKAIAERLANEIIFLQFAGSVTTAISMARQATFLSLNPEWLEALWEEQQGLIAEFGDTIDRRVLSRSAVAMAVVQETTRIHPSVRQLFRTTAADTSVGGYRVPAGTTLLIASEAAGRNLGNGTTKFDPAQWLSADRKQCNINRDIWPISFGVGPRSCVGQALATNEMLLTLILLAREVKEIKISEEEQHRAWWISHPTGLPLRLVAR